MESWNTLVQTTYGPRLIDLLELDIDLGLNDYPIFDEAYRDKLNQAIVDHFLLREIAAETPREFVFFLNRRMRENMPKANALFQFYFENKDNMVDEYMRTSTGVDESTNTGESSTHSEAKAYNSTNPQIDMTGRNNEAFYNSGSANEGDGTGTTSNTGKGTYEHRDVGRNAGVAAVAAEFIQLFQDVEQVVFDFLEPCFCQLYTDHFNGL